MKTSETCPSLPRIICAQLIQRLSNGKLRLCDAGHLTVRLTGRFGRPRLGIAGISGAKRHLDLAGVPIWTIRHIPRACSLQGEHMDRKTRHAQALRLITAFLKIDDDSTRETIVTSAD